VTNTLTYSSAALITTVKSFVVEAVDRYRVFDWTEAEVRHFNVSIKIQEET
jgi:hypothetical protein